MCISETSPQTIKIGPIFEILPIHQSNVVPNMGMHWEECYCLSGSGSDVDKIEYRINFSKNISIFTKKVSNIFDTTLISNRHFKCTQKD